MSPKSMNVGTEEVDDNCIRFHFTNLSRAGKGGVLSPTKIIGRFPWAIRVLYNNHRFVPTYELWLVCQKDARLWRCSIAKPKCIVINQDGRDNYCPHDEYMSSSDENEEEEKHLLFSPVEKEKNVITFYGKLATILREGSIKNDSVIFEVRIEINGKERGNEKGRMGAVDMHSPSVLFDCALRMGEKRIYVSRQFLGFHSEFFRTLFFGEFKEANQSEVEIKDIDPEDFYELLSILYKTGATIDVNNVDVMLRMADRFEIQCILVDCESFLLEDRSISIKECLSLADHYNRTDLKVKCINKISSVLAIKSLRDCPEFASLSGETHRLLLDRVLALYYA